MSNEKRPRPAVHRLEGRGCRPAGGSLGAAKVWPGGRVCPLAALGVHLVRGGLYEVHISIIDLTAGERGKSGAN